MYHSKLLSLMIVCAALCVLCGCELMPMTRLKPVLENPFPELTDIAVLPFINNTDSPSVDGREFAAAYASELQKVPGYNVLSTRLVEEKMAEFGFRNLRSPEDARLLARLLGVDVVVVGSVNHYHGYYPPQIAITVDWWAANQYLHPIPPGYSLPWGTTREEEIPGRIVSESERALAQAQIATQTPDDAEGEEEFREFLKFRREELTRQYRQQQGIEPQIPMPQQTLDPDDPNYEEFNPEEFKYKHTQDSSIDQQFSFAHGGKPTIPVSTHLRQMNMRNAQSMKRQIAELINEMDEDIDRPFPSPLPEGLEPSDWTDRFHSNETLQHQMHRTNKPEISEEEAAAEQTPTNSLGYIDASQVSSILAGRHCGRNAQDNTNSAAMNPAMGMVPYPPYQPAPFVGAVPQGMPYGMPPQAGFVYDPNLNVVGKVPQGMGMMIQPPKGRQGTGDIFVEFGSDGRFARAFKLDPRTGVIRKELTLEEVGLDPSSLLQSVPPMENYYTTMPGMPKQDGTTYLEPNAFPGLPENWPDSRGFIPDGPRPKKASTKTPSMAPIMSLTKHYDANDSELTQALADYDFHFRDEMSNGGWQKTLHDRTAFISFCCRLHIWEMLSSRGGARKSIEVKRTWKTWHGGQTPYM